MPTTLRDRRGEAKKRAGNPDSGHLRRRKADYPYRSAIGSGQAKCNRCLCLLPLSAFHRSRREANGYQDWCRACKRRWRGTARPGGPRSSVLSMYGVTLTDAPTGSGVTKPDATRGGG